MSDRMLAQGGSILQPYVHFGGPDKPPRVLRDLLQARIEAVPAGGQISWATYYFRDRALASALIAASERGVRICLHVEGHPRRASANREVVAMLENHGLKGGLHVHRPGLRALKALHPHLHSKIYYFSHPHPHVLVGSFNPSGDVPEDQAVIEEIGDQDRGHNLLVELADPLLTRALWNHVAGLSRAGLRFRADQNRAVEGEDTNIWFYPRLSPGVIDRHLGGVKEGGVISGAISHLKPGFLANALIWAAERGVRVTLLVHDTERRVPGALVDRLTGAGIDIARFVHSEGLPMHAKFLLIEDAGRRTSYFGSFNYNPRSRFLNHEILAASTNDEVFERLSSRFREIAAQARDFRQEP